MFLKVLALSDCCDVMLVGSFTGCFFVDNRKRLWVRIYEYQTFAYWLSIFLLDFGSYCMRFWCVCKKFNLCANLNVVIFIVPVYVWWRCSATRFRRKLCRISFILHHGWRLDFGIILHNWHHFLQLLVQNFKIVQNKLK